MAPHRYFVQLFFILMISLISSCFRLPHYDPPYNFYLDETYGYGSYDSQAHPSYYFSTINEDGKFKDLINVRSRMILSLENVGTSSKTTRTVNVDDFGAKGDGTDDTEAFMDAWKEACSNAGAVIVVPKDKTYKLKPVIFSGCGEGKVTLQIYGTIKASDDLSDYINDSSHWIRFDNVQNLLVEGGGTINGNGKIWWQNSCKTNKSLPCKIAPTAITFYKSENLIVNNLNIEDAQQMHISFENCNNVLASNLTVTSPEDSPNTDGIHVANTENIWITSSTIGTGDDCISIVEGSQNVQVEDITCGPGHGISIGSLGAKNSKAYVSRVTVNGALLSGTTNGVRIKTWQGGSGYASDIKFQNINMFNVTNPIIIDQNYCDENEPCREQSSAVAMKNVSYENIKGTSSSKVAVKFDCSKSYPCEGIVLQNVNLQTQAEDGAANAVCTNVQNLAQIGLVSPRCP